MVRASCTCLFERVIMCILLIFLMYLLTPSRKISRWWCFSLFHFVYNDTNNWEHQKLNGQLFTQKKHNTTPVMQRKSYFKPL